MKKAIIEKILIAIALLFLGAVFFVGTSAFNYTTQKYSDNGDFVKWTSPDETANYIFAKLYGQEKKLTITEDYNLELSDVMHPRSFRSDRGVLKPVSFLGIILVYGTIVSLTSYKVLPFITPFLGALGIIFYYLLVNKIFSRPVAIVSSLLLAFFPPFLYFSSRSMFHNIPFVVFLVIALYFIIVAFSKPEKQRFLELKLKLQNIKIISAALLGGIFLGLAIITRTSELMWIAPILSLALVLNIKKINLLNLPLILGGLGLAILPMAYFNQVLYGSFFSGGYPEMNRSIADIVAVGTDVASGGQLQSVGQTLFKNIFRFGFHERFSLEMFRRYFIEMFPYIFWTALGGAIIFLARVKQIRYRQVVLSISVLLTSLFLIFYYGSWEFHDNPDPNQFTIGNSYTRYWLPVYLGAIPFSALFIFSVVELLKKVLNLAYLNRKSKQFFSLSLSSTAIEFLLITILLIVYFFSSVNFVIHGSEEGLLQTGLRQIQSQAEQKELLELTESNSVIITRYHDKLLFPERKVIVGLFDDQKMNEIYARIAQRLPVYYYNFTFPIKDLDYLNERKLREVGLTISPVKSVTDVFTLYRLEPYSAGTTTTSLLQ